MSDMTCAPASNVQSHILLQAQSIRVEVGSKTLLETMDFALRAGEVTAVIGPNGAGKSTLLRVLAGDLVPSFGLVSLCGQVMSSRSSNVLTSRARHLAVLPQASALNFPYRVEEVVALGRIPHGSGRAVDASIVTEALAAVDMLHLRHQLYPQLSGGEKQRTQLARVMAQIWRAEDAAGRVLLLDEPTSALDLGHQQQLLQIVRQFAQQGVAVLMVVHDVNLALRAADRLLALHQGCLVAEGPCEQVLTVDRLQHLFGVSAELLHHPKTGQPIVVF